MNLPLVKIAQNLNVAVSTVHRIYRSMRHRKSFEYAVFLPGSADISDSNVQTSHLYALYANLSWRTVVTPYVGMAPKKNGGYNQSINQSILLF